MPRNADKVPTIHPALAAALEADRELFNQQFRWYCTNGSLIDKTAFYSHVSTRLSKLVEAVNDAFPERTRTVTQELYVASLDLFRAQFFGNESKLSELDYLWVEILPTMPHLLAREPKRIAGILSNALINISQQPSVRSTQWLDEIKRIATHCQSVSELADASVALAWICGVAALRNNALESLRKLPASIAKQILDPLQSTPSFDVASHIDSIEKNPWHSLSRSKSDATMPAPPALVHTVGAFTGFGGTFTAPPSVFTDDQRLFVHDHSSLWRLYTDRFGWTLHRASESILTTKISIKGKPNRKPKVDRDVNIASDGTVAWSKQSVRFAHLAYASSQAFDGHSLAVTLPTSFHVFVVAPVTPLSQTRISERRAT